MACSNCYHCRELDELKAALRDAATPSSTEEWRPLSEIPDGAIFETRDGIRAVKSEYRYSNEYPAIQCILLASGEYAHFAQHIKDPMPSACAHNSTPVRMVQSEAVNSSNHNTIAEAMQRVCEIASDAVEHGVVAGDWEARLIEALDALDAAREGE